MLKYFNIELNKKLTFAGRKKPVHGKSRICYTFTVSKRRNDEKKRRREHTQDQGPARDVPEGTGREGRGV